MIDDRLSSSHVEDDCHSLQRTNIKLSGNIKVVVSAAGEGWLESISSSKYLANADFKAMPIAYDQRHERNVMNLAKRASSLDYWYDVESSSELDPKSYDSQYSQKYDWGAYTEANSILKGEHRFFAPLWVEKRMPDRFLIFRAPSAEYSDLGSYFTNGTLIANFDLKLTKVGKYLRKFVDDKFRKRHSLRHSFDNGIEYFGVSLDRGEFTTHNEDPVTSRLANEKTLTECNNDLTLGYSRGKLISHKLINMEFLFDDPGATIGHYNYVGIYVFDNKVDVDTANLIKQESGILRRKAIVLNSNPIETQEYIQGSLLEDYYVTTSTNMIVEANFELAPMFMFEVKSNPDRNSKIIIKYNGQVEVEVKIEESDIKPRVNETMLAIVDRINEKSFDADNISFRAYNYYDKIKRRYLVVIQSMQNSLILENTEITVPRGCLPVTPERTDGTIVKSMIGIGRSDVVVKDKLDVSNADRLVIDSVGYMIEHYHEMIGYKVIRLANFNTDNNLQGLTVRAEKLYQSDILVCQPVKHRDFDFSTHDHYYNSILDFDLTAYRAHLTAIVENESYVGAWTPEATITLTEYRDLVKAALNKFFDPIKQTNQLLIRDLDTTTFEAASTVENEYDRLAENEVAELILKNRLEAFVCKWGSQDGTNVYAQPYGLNWALPFRTDNFAPGHRANNRDLGVHSHSWLLIGEGLPAYDERLHVNMSYTPRIDLTKLTSITENEFDKLKHRISSNNGQTWYTKHSWADVHRRDGTADRYYTFFRGVEFDLIGDYDGYKFAAILSSSGSFDENSQLAQVIVNRVWKTVTLVIKFQIPDPILTSLERGQTEYYLDRSILYYVTDVLQTPLVTQTFGTSKISLTLYDTITIKMLDGSNVGTNWYVDDYNGSRAYWVGRGDSGIFNTVFSDMLSIGDDFSWRHVRKLSTGEDVIMRFTAKNICYVDTDFFWCRDIEMYTYEFVNRSLDIEYHGWTGEGTLLDKDNEWYMSKSISYYNSIYDTIVRAKANAARYKSIAFGSLMNMLNSSVTPATFVDFDGSIIIADARVRPIEPKSTYTIVSKTSQDGEILFTDKAIAYPIYRYNGLYAPIFRDVLIPLSSANFEKHLIGDPIPSTRYLKKVTNDTTGVNVDKYTESYLRNMYSRALYFHYIDGVAKPIPTVVNREEWRGLVSSTFSYHDEFSITTLTNNRTINIVSAIKAQLLPVVMSGFELSDTDKLDILRLYYPDVNATNLSLHDVDTTIVKNFYDSFMSKVYRISSVKIDGSEVPFKNLGDGVIELNSDSTNVTLTFKK